MPIQRTEDVHRQIKEDYLSGMRLIDLSKKYNKPTPNIIELLKKYDVFIPLLKRWNESEIQYLKSNYSTKEWGELLEHLGRWTKSEITHKAYDLKLKKSNHFWSAQDISILKNGYKNNISNSDISKALNYKFSSESIHTKAYKLGITKREKWNDNEIKILLENYEVLPMDSVVRLLPNRNIDTIKAKANSLGLVSYFYKDRQWIDSEDNYIKSHWETMGDREISSNIGRTFRSVKWRREKLGLIRVVEPGTYDYLYEYIRKRNRDWKKRSAINCHFKCAISGKKFDDIHHLYGANLIIEEALANLDLSMKNVVDYSEDELQLILSEFLRIQDLYPLGICLTHQIHKSFHDIYGYGNNTPDQFEEFLKKYN